jgi:hypothetical protein
LVEQAALFYEFSLERDIPAGHLLRSIDRSVDLEQVRQDLAPFYSHIGRPSIDPELMIRILPEVRSPTRRRAGRQRTAAKPSSPIRRLPGRRRNAIIVDVEATTAIRQAEVLALRLSRDARLVGL